MQITPFPFGAEALVRDEAPWFIAADRARLAELRRFSITGVAA